MKLQFIPMPDISCGLMISEILRFYLANITLVLNTQAMGKFYEMGKLSQDRFALWNSQTAIGVDHNV
jgi:hypothetical protein